MDWKTSARVGALQVRRYEPAIALETALFLNLCQDDYPLRERLQTPELAIVIAASVAAHLVGQRQAVALFTNGRDPFYVGDPDVGGALSAAGAADEPGPAASAGGAPGDAAKGLVAPSLPLRKGGAHLMNLLDLLARVEAVPAHRAVPFLDLLRRKSLGLPWGSTAVVVTSRDAAGLMGTLLALRRRGLVVVLVLTSSEPGFAQTAQRAKHIGVEALEVRSEEEMDQWR
jgi:uncharacterized protein (DUF58 family)